MGVEMEVEMGVEMEVEMGVEMGVEMEVNSLRWLRRPIGSWELKWSIPYRQTASKAIVQHAVLYSQPATLSLLPI
jgi:hypothetical protein